MQIRSQQICNLLEKEYAKYKQDKKIGLFQKKINENSLTNLNSKTRTGLHQQKQRVGDQRIIQKYNKLLDALKVDSFNEAIAKTSRINQADKFIIRVKQMTAVCQPEKGDVSLNQAWKLIKSAVYQVQSLKHNNI